MKYMLLLYNDRTPRSADPAAGRALMAEYRAFTQSIRDSREMIAGDALTDEETATSVRVRGGRTSVVDGPFAETKEHLGGYYLIDVTDLDRAIELAARIPAARAGVVEIRPLWEFSDVPDEDG